MQVTLSAFRFAVLVLAGLSLVSGSTSGRYLLSSDGDSGLLVTYWGQNSAAPTYQEPGLDQACDRSIVFGLEYVCRAVH